MSASVKEVILLTASYYDRVLSPMVLTMYAEDLADLPADAVVDAYKAYRRDPRNTRFPLPGQIRALVEPAVDPESAAREIASRINHAIVKFGWANASAAEAYVGEVGWNIVNRSGGWSHLCQNHGVTLDPGVFQAQVRELAKSDLTHDPKRMAEVLRLPSAEACSAIPQLNPVTPVTKQQYLAEKARELASSSNPQDKAQLLEIMKAVRSLNEGAT